MNELLLIMVVPAVAGIIPLLIPRKGKMAAGIVALLAGGWMLYGAIKLFGVGNMAYNAPLFNLGGMLPFEFSLRLYNFSAFILLFVAVFGVLIILYSLGYLRKKETGGVYYTYVLWTLAAAAGAVLADNLLLL
ncbi:MAG: hypothetical protein JXB45_04190, partial [Candidatus Krumholzibacteriota bacterium]|nr:hypothetical protein [Candidatus Krumholzibacteriota bacterium]